MNVVLQCHDNNGLDIINDACTCMYLTLCTTSYRQISVMKNTMDDDRFVNICAVTGRNQYLRLSLYDHSLVFILCLYTHVSMS